MQAYDVAKRSKCMASCLCKLLMLCSCSFAGGLAGSKLCWLDICWHAYAMPCMQSRPCMQPRHRTTHLGLVRVTWGKVSQGSVWVTWVKVSLGCSQGFLETFGKETEGSILHSKNRMSQQQQTKAVCMALCPVNLILLFSCSSAGGSAGISLCWLHICWRQYARPCMQPRYKATHLGSLSYYVMFQLIFDSFAHFAPTSFD